MVLLTKKSELQALIFLLTLIVRAANRPVDYDSDDELIAPRQQVRQPLLNRPGVPAAGVPVVGTLDQRPSRNDAWSTRMREKVMFLPAPTSYVNSEACGLFTMISDMMTLRTFSCVDLETYILKLTTYSA